MKRILIIEDNPEIRENTAEILELSNYQVFTAENGKIGIEIATKETPDLIICDIMMPEMDGYGVLHVLSRNQQTNTIPFIFLSAKAERGDVRKGMEMGADDYLTKPFDDIELLNAIESRLRRSEALKTSYENNAEGVRSFLQDASEANTLVDETTHETRDYKKKQMVYLEGHRPTNLYFVVNGKVKQYKINTDGKELITEIHKAGEFFGYTPLFEDSNYQDNAEVLEDAEIMLIPKLEFVGLISSDRQIAQQFIRLMAQNLMQKEEQLLGLAYNSLRKRVANSLLHVYAKYREKAGDQPELGISREDLAQVVGTAKESLIRTLSDFKSEGLIAINQGKIVVTQEEKLKNLLY